MNQKTRKNSAGTSASWRKKKKGTRASTLSPRKHPQVAPENTCDRPAGPIIGTRENGLTIICVSRGDRAAREVKGEETEAAQAVLDVIPKHPEVEHVAEEVHPSDVNEHGRDDGRHPVYETLGLPESRGSARIGERIRLRPGRARARARRRPRVDPQDGVHHDRA